MSKPKKQVFFQGQGRSRLTPAPGLELRRPSGCCPDPKQKLAAKPKHKPTLADLLDPSGEE